MNKQLLVELARVSLIALVAVLATGCQSTPTTAVLPTNTLVPTQKAAPAATSAPPTAALPTNTVVPTAAAPTAAATAPPVTLAPTAAAAAAPAPTSIAPSAAAPATSAPTTAPTAAVAPTTAAPATSAPTIAAPPTTAPTTAPIAGEVVVYASDLQQSSLTDELTFWDDPASPGGKMIGLPNNGDKLNAPPEDDPHVTFKVPLQGRVPYHCWIHMKVGAPKGVSQANRLYVQFSDAFDKANQPVFTQGTGSYMTAQGPEQEGWTWVGCDSSDPASPASLIYFRTDGAVTVRLQAGMEGVGFDQFLLSPARFLDQPPAEAVVQK